MTPEKENGLPRRLRLLAMTCVGEAGCEGRKRNVRLGSAERTDCTRRADPASAVPPRNDVRWGGWMRRRDTEREINWREAHRPKGLSFRTSDRRHWCGNPFSAPPNQVNRRIDLPKLGSWSQRARSSWHDSSFSAASPVR